MRFEAGRLSATAAASIACLIAWTRICKQVVLRASAHQLTTYPSACSMVARIRRPALLGCSPLRWMTSWSWPRQLLTCGARQSRLRSNEQTLVLSDRLVRVVPKPAVSKRSKESRLFDHLIG